MVMRMKMPCETDKRMLQKEDIYFRERKSMCQEQGWNETTGKASGNGSESRMMLNMAVEEEGWRYD